MMRETETMLLWAERRLASVRAEHISGVAHTKADWLSRAVVDQSEWQLHPDIFQEIVQRFSLPSVDLSATPLNAQLPWFFTRYRESGAEKTMPSGANGPGDC
uniref:Uncharacterized protein n=1 Tax=Micrurus carvalhoi TaxID=3147026 RepID=A0A2H6N8Y7_9SAUR